MGWRGWRGLVWKISTSYKSAVARTENRGGGEGVKVIEMTTTMVVEVDIGRGIEGERCTDITAYSREKE